MVTNTVRYMDGTKHHINRGDLAKMKELTNDMCREKDLPLKVPVVTEKSVIEEILKVYMIKRKAGRADGGELPRNYALIHRRRSRKLMKWNCRLWVDYTEIVADNSINIYVD